MRDNQKEISDLAGMVMFFHLIPIENPGGEIKLFPAGRECIFQEGERPEKMKRERAKIPATFSPQDYEDWIEQNRKTCLNEYEDLGRRIADHSIHPIIFCKETVDRLIGYGIKSIQERRAGEIRGIYRDYPTFQQWNVQGHTFHGLGKIFEICLGGDKSIKRHSSSLCEGLHVSLPTEGERNLYYSPIEGPVKRIHYAKDWYKNGTSFYVNEPQQITLQRELTEERDRIIKIMHEQLSKRKETVSQ